MFSSASSSVSPSDQQPGSPGTLDVLSYTTGAAITYGTSTETLTASGTNSVNYF
jgi:hypothetical protein